MGHPFSLLLEERDTRVNRMLFALMMISNLLSFEPGAKQLLHVRRPVRTVTVTSDCKQMIEQMSQSDGTFQSATRCEIYTHD